MHLAPDADRQGVDFGSVLAPDIGGGNGGTSLLMRAVFASKLAILSTRTRSLSGTKWSKMSEPDRLDFVSIVVDHLTNHFRLSLGRPEVVPGNLQADAEGKPFLNDALPVKPQYRGAYAPEQHVLFLNRFHLGNLASVVETVAHEMRHAYQADQVRRISDGAADEAEAQVWKDNFANPKNSKTDRQGYWNMAIERDAREFAANFIKQLGL